MKIQSFSGIIKKVKYLKIKDRYSVDKEYFCCNAVIIECCKGRTKYRPVHNVLFYMSENDFNNKIIEVGDKLKILDTAKLQSKIVDFKSYKEDLIKNADSSELATDESGRTYYKTKLFSTKIMCKVGSYVIENKFDELAYCTIKNSGVKLSLENKQYSSENILEYYLDKEEFEKIKNIENGSICEVIFYYDKSKYDEQNRRFKINADFEKNIYNMKLILE